MFPILEGVTFKNSMIRVTSLNVHPNYIVKRRDTKDTKQFLERTYPLRKPGPDFKCPEFKTKMETMFGRSPIVLK